MRRARFNPLPTVHEHLSLSEMNTSYASRNTNKSKLVLTTYTHSNWITALPSPPLTPDEQNFHRKDAGFPIIPSSRYLQLAERHLSTLSHIKNPRVLVVGMLGISGEGEPGVEYSIALEGKLAARTRLFDIQYYDPWVCEGSAYGKENDIRRWTEWRTSSLQECFDVVVVMVRQQGIDWEVLDRCDNDKVSVIYEC